MNTTTDWADFSLEEHWEIIKGDYQEDDYDIDMDAVMAGAYVVPPPADGWDPNNPPF